MELVLNVKSCFVDLYFFNRVNNHLMVLMSHNHSQRFQFRNEFPDPVFVWVSRQLRSKLSPELILCVHQLLPSGFSVLSSLTSFSKATSNREDVELHVQYLSFEDQTSYDSSLRVQPATLSNDHNFKKVKPNELRPIYLCSKSQKG